MDKIIKDRIDAIRQGLSANEYTKTEIGVCPCNWQVKKLSDIAEKVTQTAGTNSYETVSISAGIGFVNQAKKFGKELSGKQYEKYTVLHKGDFSYNKGNSNKYPQGCIYRLKDRETAAVPNVFESFRIQDGCAEFYDHLFISGFLNQQLSKKINRGVRDDGLLNLTEKDFYSCLLPFPPLVEQKRISEILDHFDKLINLCEAKVNEYKSLKKTCLCKMFPQNGSNVPELRFPGFTGAWEQRKLGELGEILTGSTPATSNTEYYSEDGIPWVTPTDINSQTISDTPKKLSEKGAKVGRVVPENTILCTCIASIGKNTLLTVKGSFNQQINSLTPYNENDAYFLLTESEIWSEKMKRMAASGTMEIVNKTEFSELTTKVPKSVEQEKIGLYFRHIDNLITLHQREADEYTRLKKAMTQLLLTGIVRV